MEKFTKEEVLELMLKAFEAGFKKYDIVEAGLEPKEEDVECGWILAKYMDAKKARRQ